MLLLILLFLQLILTYFLPLNITSGDGAELVAAIALNGIAHPSGYPLYTFLAKIFTFMPFGTIAFKVSFFSSICATFSLYLIYEIIFNLTENKIASFLGVISLFLSYSFFYQSLFQKFYTLNLLIILLLLYLGIKTIHNGYKVKYQLLIFFILGLSFSCHHTALLMVIPFLIIAILNFREFIKNFLQSLVFFLLGSFINFSIYVKLSKLEYTLFPMAPTIKNFILNYIFRGIYKKENSIYLIKESFHSLKDFVYAIINSFKIIQVNFPLYITYVFFILGIIFIYRLNKKIFIFIITGFLTYSVILCKITFPMHHPTVFDYYIYANQYFLPMLAIFSIICSFGFSFLLKLSKNKFSIVYYILTYIPIFYLIIFPIRIKDNFWSSNWAVYQSRVDKLFAKPINSLYITKGDNPVFQTAYLKKVANFRNDICQIMYISSEKNYFINCFRKAKKDNEYYSFNLENFLLDNYNSSFPYIYTTENMNKLYYFWVFKNISDYLLIPKNEIIKKDLSLIYSDKACNISDSYNLSLIKNENFKIKKEYTDKILLLQHKLRRFYNYIPCLEHSTDDYFTYGNCYASYVRNRFIPDNIKKELIKYNSALMPYILVDKRLKEEFTKVILNEIQ